ncbi:perlucin-like protein [Pomacea canaliculata]|uniref:perlucin-like protein n=1 Tax=Pomacea canaliculata TaxID=400727 RepID=UPI000D739127|nr:perlucin-like protein [Pomacea canaliculata]
MSVATFFLLLALGGMCHCSPCPPSWTQYERSCYAYIPHSLTWSDAASLCRTLGGYLVQITSAAENNFVRNLIGGKNVWLGINDILQDGRWVLTTTGKPLPYSNWEAGQPNNIGGTETCAQMSSTGLWHDNTISSQMPSVCERSATPFMVS